MADGSYKQYVKYGQVLKDKLHVSEESINQLRDIVKNKSAKSLKFKDGSMKIDIAYGFIGGFSLYNTEGST